MGKKPNHQLWETDQTINFGKVTKPSILGKLLTPQLWERFELEFEFEFAAFEIEFEFKCECEFEVEFGIEFEFEPSTLSKS